MDPPHPEVHWLPSTDFMEANRAANEYRIYPRGPDGEYECAALSALQYVHVRRDRHTRGFQIECPSEAAARSLAQDLSLAFVWPDTQKPEVDGHMVTYHGSL